MENITLLIAFVSCVLVLVLPASLTLVIYVAGLVWYPTYVTAKLGTLDFSIPRIVILAVFMKILLDKTITSRFRWIWLDYLVIATSACAIIANVIVMPTGEFWEFHAGAQFDSLMVYFAARLLITSRKTYSTLLKGLLIIALPMTILAIYQCITSVNPVGFFKQFHAWQVREDVAHVRFGLCRADLTFAHPIMLGLFLGIIGSWCMGLWHFLQRRWHFVFVGSMVLIFLGILSSMSSGPQLYAIGSIFTFLLFRYRRYWKAFLIAVILCIVLIDIGSNRRWYYVCSSYLAFNAQTAYGRCKLIEHTLGGGMSGHWIAGFGGMDPGWWEVLGGTKSKGTDITNHYIVTLVNYGLVGLIPFVALILQSCRCIRKAFLTAMNNADRWLIWSLFASVTGTLLAMFSVSLSGQLVNSFYMMLGLSGAMSEIMSRHIVLPVIANGELIYNDKTRLIHTTT